nr:MAG TPA: hypothetical protein [Crassvirales sp.]DAR56547.1 MAG TPA: hypothetical protein [Crassvirales sp.]
MVLRFSDLTTPYLQRRFFAIWGHLIFVKHANY